MNEITISVTKDMTDPPYAKTTAGLLAAARSFYQDPENEEAYQEWKKSRREVTSE